MSPERTKRLKTRLNPDLQIFVLDKVRLMEEFIMRGIKGINDF